MRWSRHEWCVSSGSVREKSPNLAAYRRSWRRRRKPDEVVTPLTGLSLLFKPGRKAFSTHHHPIIGAGKCQPDIAVAIGAVEIGTGRNRNMGLIQDAITERLAVIGEVTDVGIEIEGTVDRREAIEAGGRQAAQKRFPVLLVDIEPEVELIAAIERGQGSFLGECGC